VTVVMPKWAPLVKVSNCRSFGANVILHGDSYDDAKKQALELAKQKRLITSPASTIRPSFPGRGRWGWKFSRMCRMWMP
jgi:hypothetical protein